MTTFKLLLFTISRCRPVRAGTAQPARTTARKPAVQATLPAAPNGQAVSTPARLLSVFDEAGES